jgi:hypothetical protein
MLNAVMVNVVIINVVMLNIVVFNVIMLNIVMLNAVMLIVDMLSVTAPFGYDITIIFFRCINYTWGLYYITFLTIIYGLL